MSTGKRERDIDCHLAPESGVMWLWWSIYRSLSVPVLTDKNNVTYTSEQNEFPPQDSQDSLFVIG